jgi:hypothetical protein
MTAWRRLALALTLAAGALVALLGLPAVSSGAAALPAIHHVFVIVLENESSSSTFGNPSADPYLATTLRNQGAYVPNYFATGHESNDNYVSLISGQPPNLLNQTDCLDYVNFLNLITLGGINEGLGCVYPAATQTIATQLTAAGKTWKDYAEDMGNVPSRESPACGHPALNSIDKTQSAVSGDGYATRHNPFVYFHSVIDNTFSCNQHVVALGSPSGAMPASALPSETGLAIDLRTVASTPNFSFIVPNLCNDGHDFPCVNQPSGASALADIDHFLSSWVPLITSSQAFQQDGLLEIVFDEGSTTDTASCCGETPGLTSLLPGLLGPGGGKVGALLLSPFIAPGTVSTTSYNHYSSLASWESIFGLPRLGEASTVTTTFGSDVFTRP